jgi:hypothetical protein
MLEIEINKYSLTSIPYTPISDIDRIIDEAFKSFII